MAEERMATKEEILENLKQAYKKHRLTYKEYMLELKKTEKYYDVWKAAYDKAKYGDTSSPTIDMTNEELAVGKKMSELQNKEKPVNLQEDGQSKENDVENTTIETQSSEDVPASEITEEK